MCDTLHESACWELPAELNERLNVRCIACACEFQIAPSFLMRAFGINSGAGHCPRCDERLHFEAKSSSAARTELFVNYVRRTEQQLLSAQEGPNGMADKTEE